MRARWFVALLLGSSTLHAQEQSQSEHVAPDPPATHMHDMPYDEMAVMMGMDDRGHFGKVTLERLEWRPADGSFAWDANAWYGGDIDKVWLEAEGERARGDTPESRLELAWDRIVSRWWSLRAGVRHDGGPGPARDWLAVGVAGLAPGFIEVESSLYYGEGGRSAFRLTTWRDLLLTQRAVLRPEMELAAYGRDDQEKRVSAGLSDLKLGLRLRYEWRREIAPYLGAQWVGHFGDNAGPDEWQWLAGLRAWF